MEGKKLVKIGYARVSGTSQELTEQVEALRKEGCEVNNIYSEKFTGMKKERPMFTEVLNALAEGDTLVVTKMDRFARSAEDGIALIKSLINRGIAVHILNMGMVDNTPSGRLLVNILACFAEFERDLIVERLSEGKAIAKLRDDYKEGRPNKYTKKQLEHALSLLDGNSFTQVATLTGISKSTLVRATRKAKGV